MNQLQIARLLKIVFGVAVPGILYVVYLLIKANYNQFHDPAWLNAFLLYVLLAGLAALLPFGIVEVVCEWRCWLCGGKIVHRTRYVAPVDEMMTFTRTIKHFDSAGNETGYSEEAYEAPGHMPGYSSNIEGEYECAKCRRYYSPKLVDAFMKTQHHRRK